MDSGKMWIYVNLYFNNECCLLTMKGTNDNHV